MTLRRIAAASVLGFALIGAALPLRGLVADIVTTNIYLIQEGEVETGDAYVAADSARVAGTIDGDLVISTSSLTISGTVTGDVLVASYGTVSVAGDIDGSLRGIAREVIVDGTVGDDVIVVAAATRISGDVARDALVFGGSLAVEGSVGRDVKGRMVSALLDGTVGNDVDVAVGNLTVEGATVVDGDVLYRSGSDADVAATAQVAGQFERLPTRGSFTLELVLTVATVLGLFAFLFAGIVLLWLFRVTAPRAVAAIDSQPLRAIAVGVGGIVVLPIIALVFVLTLVGVPVALALLVLLLLSLIFAPVPAVTVLGSRILRRRWGLFAAFIVGATIWRAAIWFIPLLGFALYLVALAIGLGGWLIAMWEQRRTAIPGADLLPRSKSRVAGQVPPPVDWQGPLAPGTLEARDEGESSSEPDETES
jgi:hypothetical protein